MWMGTGRTVAVLCLLAWMLSTRWDFYVQSQFTDAWGVRLGRIYFRHVAYWGRVIDAKDKGLLSPARHWNLVVYRNSGPMEWLLDYTSGGATGAGSIPLAVPVGGWLVCEAFVLACRIAHRESRRVRTAKGMCPVCEYDRSGIALKAPCPECGVTPAQHETPVQS